MNITFDPAKDAANIAKHGVSLSQAHRLDWGRLSEKADDRRDYGETRIVGYAPIG